VHVEVVRGGAQRVPDDTGVLAHVRRKLAAAAAAERVADGLVEIATRALLLLGKILDLVPGQLHCDAILT
jgi:hypothetical protein